MIKPARKAKKGASLLACYKVLKPDEVAAFHAKLTPVAREFVDVIGIKKALILFSEFNGREIIFPKDAHGNGAKKFKAIADHIGNDAVIALRKHFADAKVYIPNCSYAFHAVKRYRIISTYDELTKTISGNMAVRQIGKAFNMTERAVEQLLNRPAT